MARVRAFLAFWYDFLVGDRMELFVGPIVAVGATWLLVRAHVAAGLTGPLLFVLVAGVGALSVVLTLLE